MKSATAVADSNVAVLTTHVLTVTNSAIVEVRCRIACGCGLAYGPSFERTLNQEEL